MKNSIRKTLLIIVSALLIVTAVACELPKKDDPSVTYDTDVAYSPQMYTSYINKQIEPVTNALVSQMGLADKVCEYEYPVEDAIKSGKSAIELIDKSIKGVDNVLPPAQYMSLREDTLQALVNAKDTIETYVKELEQPNVNSARIKSCRDLMEGDFITLTGLFNVYNQ